VPTHSFIQQGAFEPEAIAAEAHTNGTEKSVPLDRDRHAQKSQRQDCRHAYVATSPASASVAIKVFMTVSFCLRFWSSAREDLADDRASCKIDGPHRRRPIPWARRREGLSLSASEVENGRGLDRPVAQRGEFGENPLEFASSRRTHP